MLKISDGGAGLLTAMDEKGKERLYVIPADTAEGTLVEIQRPGSGESGWLILHSREEVSCLMQMLELVLKATS